MAAHNELGRWGEELAARHLERQGFKILFRDWHCGHRDLDLIAQKEDEDLLVIVEVKTRRNERFGDASLAVTPQKIRSIIIANNAYKKTYQVHRRIRFDIITIVGSNNDNAQLEHIIEAFNPCLAY